MTNGMLNKKLLPHLTESQSMPNSALLLRQLYLDCAQKEGIKPHLIFSLNVFTEFSKFITVKGLKPATSCVRDQDATTAPGSSHAERQVL